ncbi:MAG: 16S rRNA (adenine(1518)-N(6)/adenine(1519)-N(6))-dimethyltransferase RsmA [Pseudomonadota bacterium]|nr:16S rRNA (adenine(1518)-N(6)/adenine(1519)-N(6))-dimethyltransferase RsmA [Pseudomonadota bacterium]
MVDNNKLSLKKIIKEYNLNPKKGLGQNFLHDKNIISSIINNANIKNEDIFEIGPGPAILTELMLINGANSVFCIEKDISFELKLLELKNNYKDKFEYKFLDILDFDFDKYPKKDFKIISNLPYNISVPFIFKILESKKNISWKEMILMVQKEVADRLIATKGNKNYGRLSVMVKWKNEVERLFNIKPTSFIPKPKVESSLIRIKPNNNFTTTKYSSLEKLVKLSFAHRRKTIKNNLNNLDIDTDKLLLLSKINPRERAENIDIKDFCNLSNNYDKIILERTS